MQAQTQIKSWGNGQEIKLSKEILREAHLQVEDYLQITVKDSNIILSRKFQHRSLRERAAAYGGELHLSEEIEWDENKNDKNKTSGGTCK